MPVCYPQLAQFASYIPQDHLPRSGNTHNRLTSHKLSIHQENVPTPDLPTGQIDGDNFSIKVSTSQMAQVYVNLTKNKNENYSTSMYMINLQTNSQHYTKQQKAESFSSKI